MEDLGIIMSDKFNNERFFTVGVREELIGSVRREQFEGNFTSTDTMPVDALHAIFEHWQKKHGCRYPLVWSMVEQKYTIRWIQDDWELFYFASQLPKTITNNPNEAAYHVTNKI